MRVINNKIEAHRKKHIILKLEHIDKFGEEALL